MMKLLEIIDLAIDSKSKSVNCESLKVVLNEIVLQLNLTDHSIELKNDDETVECLAVIDEQIEEDSTSNISQKSVESRLSNFHFNRGLSEKISCIEKSDEILKNVLNASVFDVVNMEKRLDALEIGVRALSDALERIQLNFMNQLNLMANKQVEPDILSSLNDRIEWLSDEIRKFNCEKSNSGDVEKVESNYEDEEIDDATRKEKNVDEFLISLQSDVNDIRLSLRDYEDEENQFMKSVNKQLETFRSDLINCLSEIQDMMDCKLDKCFVPDLKKLIEEGLSSVNEKLEEISSRKSRKTAAGTTKALIRDVNCVSCGENCVQSDTHNLPTQQQQFSVRKIEYHQQQLSSYPTITTTRHCGGKY